MGLSSVVKSGIENDCILDINVFFLLYVKYSTCILGNHFSHSFSEEKVFSFFLSPERFFFFLRERERE